MVANPCARASKAPTLISRARSQMVVKTGRWPSEGRRNEAMSLPSDGRASDPHTHTLKCALHVCVTIRTRPTAPRRHPPSYTIPQRLTERRAPHDSVTVLLHRVSHDGRSSQRGHAAAKATNGLWLKRKARLRFAGCRSTEHGRCTFRTSYCSLPACTRASGAHSRACESGRVAEWAH